MTTLDERKAEILRAIVERYVETAQPVGSQTVTDTTRLGVSAATVRNEMGILERDGYITQPHTSAGRVPTDRGYRYYVDHLAGSGSLPATDRREVADFFMSAARAIDELLHETSQLLARLTHHAAVVVGPQTDVEVIRSAHLARLEPTLLVAVVVLSNGSVEKELVALPDGCEAVDEQEASGRLHQLLEGCTIASLASLAGAAPDARGADATVDIVVRTACAALHEHCTRHTGEPLYVGGASHLAAEQEAFSTAASTAHLLGLLEQHVVLAAVLRELLGPGLTVRIGSEIERADLQECSLVLAPFMVEGQPAGTLGVLGPTRMDYRKARAAVATISAQLGRQLSR